MAWLSSWSHRKTITITGQTGAGTNYQVNLSIGDASGGDFHLENHCTSFPNDITVTDNNQTTLLDHWVEDLTVDPISMWVEVADDLGSNADVCVYYDKSGESSASNGAETFIQYHGAATADFVDSLIIPYSNIIYESNTYISSGDEWAFGVGTDAGGAGDRIYMDIYKPTGRVYCRTVNNGASTTTNDLYTIVYGTVYRFKFTTDGTTVKFYINDTIFAGDLTTTLPDTNLGLYMNQVGAATGGQEWSFVRKYNDPEPAFSSAGSEESAPAVGQPTMARWHGIPGMNYTGRVGVSW